MLISKALIKYGYSNFKLEIIELCNPSENVSREQYYIDLNQPEYNILEKAGSTLGYKHSEETKIKFRERVLTPEHKSKLLEHLRFHNQSPEQKERSRKRILELNKLKGHQVEVIDIIKNETSYYPSIRQAAEAIGCTHRTILNANKAFREKGVRLIKKRYQVKILKVNDE